VFVTDGMDYPDLGMRLCSARVVQGLLLLRISSFSGDCPHGGRLPRAVPARVHVTPQNARSVRCHQLGNPGTAQGLRFLHVLAAYNGAKHVVSAAVPGGVN